jgi:hypothetical protein
VLYIGSYHSSFIGKLRLKDEFWVKLSVTKYQGLSTTYYSNSTIFIRQ